MGAKDSSTRKKKSLGFEWSKGQTSESNLIVL